MNELIKILESNNIKYYHSFYADIPSIVIKKNKYKLEIYKDNFGYGSDLQKIPYTWGRNGSTTIKEIIEDLKEYLGISIVTVQLTLF